LFKTGVLWLLRAEEERSRISYRTAAENLVYLVLSVDSKEFFYIHCKVNALSMPRNSLKSQQHP
jgi:hypothetical protein